MPKATPMDIKTQNQVLNALVDLTRLLQRYEPNWYTRGHDSRAITAIEAALQRPLVNYNVSETQITEWEIDGSDNYQQIRDALDEIGTAAASALAEAGISDWGDGGPLGDTLIGIKDSVATIYADEKMQKRG